MSKTAIWSMVGAGVLLLIGGIWFARNCASPPTQVIAPPGVVASPLAREIAPPNNNPPPGRSYNAQEMEVLRDLARQEERNKVLMEQQYGK